jgi:predicted nucleotidyltransferase
VPRAAIRKYVRKIVECFKPQRVILFGSHAYGTPHADSEVDLLIVMPCRSMIDMAVRIRLAFGSPFFMDLLVYTPEYLQKRLDLGDWFVREVLDKGLVLYDATHP